MADINDMNKLTGSEFAVAFGNEVRDRLIECRGDWPALLEVSGGTLSRPWLSGFAQGKIASPSLPLLAHLAMLLGMRLSVKPCNSYKDRMYKP